MYFILAIFANNVPSRETSRLKAPCVFMVFSNAQPVQFWPIECDTYNQNEPDGVRKRCFYNTWNCTDEIVFQVLDDGGSPGASHTFSVSVRDESNLELLSVPLALGPRLSLADLADGENYGTGDDWTIGATPSIDSSGTKIFRLQLIRAQENIDYVFHYKISKSGGILSIGTLTLGIYDEDMNLIDSINLPYTSASVTFEDDITFNSTGLRPKYIGVSNSALQDTTIQIQELYLVTLDTTPYVYNGSFTPDELCDQDVQFIVVDETLNVEVGKSDPHSIKSVTDDTVYATYWNNVNVFGLVYDDNEPKFNLRIPAIFFHQRFPEEDGVIELTHSLVTTNGSVRKQRLLDTDYMPYYMHEKIKLILKHQFVQIFNKYWTKQEAYEIQDGNRTWPHKKAKCWISEKDYLQRNVL